MDNQAQKSLKLSHSDFFTNVLNSCLQASKTGFDHLKGPILALDPGETTGYAVYVGDKTFICGQLATGDIPEAQHIDHLLEKYNPKHVRYEDYRIYGWKTGEHAGTKLHTPELIGAIQWICHQRQIPYSAKLAVFAKQFWTDEKLKKATLYGKGLKHGRDAMRHLLLYMCFPNK